MSAICHILHLSGFARRHCLFLKITDNHAIPVDFDSNQSFRAIHFFSSTGENLRQETKCADAISRK
ncbi:Uncharacterized protein APZ42_001108 [Daphnia magna]|uniref:Uncharacterized protein n=1 Tax=Daphnia magna TaxID=35525 RepID=A0A164J608_9CRUS|nr:Uncharacterized protein APZ42_001108 [Daphnia magna]